MTNYNYLLILWYVRHCLRTVVSVCKFQTSCPWTVQGFLDGAKSLHNDQGLIKEYGWHLSDTEITAVGQMSKSATFVRFRTTCVIHKQCFFGQRSLSDKCPDRRQSADTGYRWKLRWIRQNLGLLESCWTFDYEIDFILRRFMYWFLDLLTFSIKSMSQNFLHLTRKYHVAVGQMRVTWPNVILNDVFTFQLILSIPAAS